MTYTQGLRSDKERVSYKAGDLRRNICTFLEEIKKRAYQAIVRPNVEYATVVHGIHIRKIILRRL